MLLYYGSRIFFDLKICIFEGMSWFGKKDKLQLIAFQTYGTEAHFYARGRALEDENIDLAAKGFFKLFVNSLKRFETDEIKNASVIIRLSNGKIFEGITNKNGYYLINEPAEGLNQMINEEGWLQYKISFESATLKTRILHKNSFSGEMLIPSKSSKFGVISDIDDTILHTGVSSSLKWRVVFNTFFKNVDKRMPLEGSARFYHLLHKGVSGNEANPIFYVSHSPWNLYRYLELFLKKNNFPKGPILLRSISDFGSLKNRKQKPQKQKEIENIFKSNPRLRFILIGDSGELDADIYIAISKEYPNQVAAIYLRSVKHKKKMLRVRKLVENHKNTLILLVDKSEDAIKHARQNGFI